MNMLSKLKLLGSSRSLIAITLFIFLLLIYFPSLRLNFSLLDDGLTLRNARLISEGIDQLDFVKVGNIILEPQHGRVRPVYWLVQSVLVWFSLHNSFLMHIYRFLILLMTLLIAKKILEKFGVHQIISALLLFFYGFNIQNLENYYRLGPTEPFLVFYYISLIFVIYIAKYKSSNKQFFLAAVIFFFGAFTKENFFLVSIPLIVGHLIMIYNKKKRSQEIKITLLLVVIATVATVLIFAIKSFYPYANTYSSNYMINFEQISSSLRVFLRDLTFYQPILFEISVIYGAFFIFRIVFVKKFKNLSYEDVFLFVLWSQAVLQFGVLLPWKYALSRYLALVNINLILIYGITIQRIYAYLDKNVISKIQLPKYNKSLALLLILLVACAQLITRSYFAVANYQLFQMVDSKSSNESVKMMANNIPHEETVFVNYKKGDSNIEIFKATGWHLVEIYERGDLAFEYIDEENLCTKIDRYVFDRKSDRFLKSDTFDSDDFVKIDTGETVYMPINYGAVARSFYYKTKLENWHDEYLFDWTLYTQKSNTCIKESSIL